MSHRHTCRILQNTRFSHTRFRTCQKHTCNMRFWASGDTCSGKDRSTFDILRYVSVWPVCVFVCHGGAQIQNSIYIHIHSISISWICLPHEYRWRGILYDIYIHVRDTYEKFMCARVETRYNVSLKQTTNEPQVPGAC